MAFNAALHKLDGVPMQFWCLTAVASLWVAVGTGAFECAVKAHCGTYVSDLLYHHLMPVS
jgi:hypothetical protein